jgi:hypothetical protein
LFSIIWALYFVRGVSRYFCLCLTLVSHDDATRRVDVPALVVDSSMSDSRADHGVASDFHGVDAFDQAFQSCPEVAATALPKAGRMSVAIDGSPIAHLVLFRDIAGAAPVKEILLDISAITVAANYTVGLVMVQADPSRASPRRGSGALPIFIFSGHENKASANFRSRQSTYFFLGGVRACGSGGWKSQH